MKTTLLFLFLIITSSLLGQYTQIPDPNFEEALIDQGWDDKKDGKVLTKNIAEVRQLWLFNMEAQRGWGVKDLTGIEDFVSLEYLDFQLNEVKKINLSNNKSLNYLDCSGNGLEELDLSNCPELVELFCYDNKLKSLDLSKNKKIMVCICDGNDFECESFGGG
jgi:hypothetical protein